MRASQGVARWTLVLLSVSACAPNDEVDPEQESQANASVTAISPSANNGHGADFSEAVSDAPPSSDDSIAQAPQARTFGFGTSCSPNPCQNGGRCTDLWQGYSCKCPAGFTGTRCQTRQSTCGNGKIDAGESCDPKAPGSSALSCDTTTCKPITSASSCFTYTKPTGSTCGGLYCGVTQTKLASALAANAVCNQPSAFTCSNVLPLAAEACGRDIKVKNPLDSNDQLRPKVNACLSARPELKGTSISANCTNCFTNFSFCQMDNCLIECLAGDSPECDRCTIGKGCLASLYSCSGLPNPLPPPCNPATSTCPPAPVSGTAAGCTSYGAAASTHCGGYYCGVTQSQLASAMTPGGVCGNITSAQLCTSNLRNDVGMCGRNAKTASPLSTDAELRPQIEQCARAKADYSYVTSGCMGCYVDSELCAENKCLIECLTGDSPDCDSCRKKNNCDQALYSCGGLPSPF